MNQELTNFEQWLLTSLNNFSVMYFKEENRTGAFVTESILELIADYGRNHFNYNVCFSGGSRAGHEKGWLYDLVWYTDDDKKYLKTTELALELEQLYGISHISYDFEKLLLANAKIKVMICLAGKIPIDIIKDYFDNAVAAYEDIPKGTRFFTLIWDDWMGGEDDHFVPHVITKE